MRHFIAKTEVDRFLPAQEGATAIEYAIIAAGIAGVLIAIVNTVGGQMAAMWASIAAMFS